jgi:hypothetical protein
LLLPAFQAIKYLLFVEPARGLKVPTEQTREGKASPYLVPVLQKDIYNPANSAAPPTAPRIAAVGRAANTPAPPVMPPAVMVVVGMTPEVNGASCTGVAPEKAGVWVVAVGFGVAPAIIGLSTLKKGRKDQVSKLFL